MIKKILWIVLVSLVGCDGIYYVYRFSSTTAYPFYQPQWFDQYVPPSPYYPQPPPTPTFSPSPNQLLQYSLGSIAPPSTTARQPKSPNITGARRLTPEQVVVYAYQAGFRGKALVNSIAIAMAESGNDPLAVGDKTVQTEVWGPSIGLWQIRTLKRDYGQRNLRDASILPDPLTNARACWEISRHGIDWSPWTTFRKNLHKPFLKVAADAARKIEATSGIMSQK